MPKASIIIPAHNMAKFIRLTLDSVLGQDFTNFECIIIDDGSSDNTAEIVKSYTDERIKYIYQECSGGPSKPRNLGLHNASGEYVFLFDADDVMCPGKLSRSIAVLDKHSDCDMLFTDFSSIDDVGKILKPDYLLNYGALWGMFPHHPDVDEAVVISAEKVHVALLHENFIGTSSVVLRKSALTDNDIFNEELKNSDDRLFWLLFTKSHKVVYLNANLHLYRVQPNSISNQGFIRRGPSKIKALKIVYASCHDAALKRVIKKQIARDYATLAYAYKQKKMYTEQINNAKESLRLALSLKAFKLFVYGLLMKNL